MRPISALSMMYPPHRTQVNQPKQKHLNYKTTTNNTTANEGKIRGLERKLFVELETDKINEKNKKVLWGSANKGIFRCAFSLTKPVEWKGFVW